MHKVFSPYYAVRQNNRYTVPILRLLMEFEARLRPQVPRDTAGGPLGPHPSSLISSRNKHWETPMHLFINLSPLTDDDALRWILGHGADLNAGNWRGQPPLHIAVSRPILSAAHISAMLETADIIAKTDDGETVLQIAEKPVKSAIYEKLDSAVLDLLRERRRLVIESGEVEARDATQRERRKAEIKRLMVERRTFPLYCGRGEYGY